MLLFAPLACFAVLAVASALPNSGSSDPAKKGLEAILAEPNVKTILISPAGNYYAGGEVALVPSWTYCPLLDGKLGTPEFIGTGQGDAFSFIYRYSPEFHQASFWKRLAATCKAKFHALKFRITSWFSKKPQGAQSSNKATDKATDKASDKAKPGFWSNLFASKAPGDKSTKKSAKKAETQVAEPVTPAPWTVIDSKYHRALLETVVPTTALLQQTNGNGKVVLSRPALKLKGNARYDAVTFKQQGKDLVQVSMVAGIFYDIALNVAGDPQQAVKATITTTKYGEPVVAHLFKKKLGAKLLPLGANTEWYLVLEKNMHMSWTPGGKEDVTRHTEVLVSAVQAFLVQMHEHPGALVTTLPAPATGPV